MAIKPEHRAAFEKMGIESVRTSIKTKRFSTERQAHATAWVEEQERAQSRIAAEQTAATQAEHLKIARSANEAAWESAQAAKKANTLAETSNKHAKTANRLAIAAVIVAVVALAVSTVGTLGN